jgi:hypothetical protein
MLLLLLQVGLPLQILLLLLMLLLLLDVELHYNCFMFLLLLQILLLLLMLLLLLQVGLLLLVTTRANPPLTIFGNEYVFSTFHYPTDPNAGKAHREEYARKVTLQVYNIIVPATLLIMY